MDPFARLIDFETVADSSAASAGAPAGGDLSPTDPAATVGGAQAGESESPSADATGPAPAGTPQYDFTDPAFVDGIQGLLEQQLAPIAEVLQQLYPNAAQQQPQQYGQPQMPDVQLDPFDESFGGNLAQLLAANQQQTLEAMQALVGQVTQPMQQQQEQQAIAEGEQRAQDIIADDIARNGDLPQAAREQVWPLAKLMFQNEFQARYGTNDRAVEMALSKAAGVMRSIVAEAKQSGADEYANRLGNLTNAPREPGAGAPVGMQHGGIRARSIEEGLSAVTTRHAAALRGA